MMVRTSAWDRQRAAIRTEIMHTAVGLFLAQGFESTTIDQIVDVVGVSRRSFFRYFGTKEDVVLGDLIGRGEVIASKLADRPLGEDAWSALRAAFHDSQETIMLDPASELALGRMLFETPSLRARFLEKRLRWQQLLVPLIEQRLRGDPPTRSLRASAIVASALACLDAASEAWVSGDGSAELGELYDEAVTAIRN